MLSVSAAFSTYYVDNLAGEVSKGYRAKFARGGWIGLLPLGYESQFDHDAKGERIKGTSRAVFSGDITTVRLAFELYASGNYSDLSIAEDLNTRGLTTIHKGHLVPFQRDSIKTILTNRFYLRFVTYLGEERRGTHEPAISQDLWDRCQAVRVRRSRQDGGRLPVRGAGGLLSELAYCGRCGARMHTQLCGEGESRQRYYRCSARRRFGISVCAAEFVPAREIEPMVLDVLRACAIPPTQRDAVIDVVQQRLARPATPAAQNMAQLEAQLTRLRDLYELGDLEKAEYLRRRETLHRQIARAAPAPSRVLDIERAIEVLSDRRTLLEAATGPTQQRPVLQQIFDIIWIEKGAVTAIRPAHNFALLIQTARMWSKRPRLGSNQQPSAPEADALSD